MPQKNKITDTKQTVVFSLENLYDSCLKDEKAEFSEFSEFYNNFPGLKERYIDEKKIAEGGMKTIFKVFDQHIGRYLAMAKLNEPENEKGYMPFIREARLTANLEHPNIIKVHEMGFYEERKPYFTMELKTGDSLKDILIALSKQEKGYTEQYTLRSLLVIFLKICDAVSYSHSRKVIHLDIKPENIQVGDYGEVMLCDWGLAKVIGLEDLGDGHEVLLDPNQLNNLTLHSEIKGTPGYMAPEQVAKDEEKDHRTDIYALGALLYSILTYKVPIDGDLEDVLFKTIVGDFPTPSKRTPHLNIPDGLEAIVMKSMEVKKEERYPAVKDLIVDVNKYLDGYSPAAEEASIDKELMLFYRRNKKVCLLTLFFLFILGSGSAYFISSLKTSRDEAITLRDEAIVQRRLAEKNLGKYKEEKSYLDPMLSSDPSPLILQLKEKFFTEIESAPEATLNALIKAFERISETNPSHVPLYEIKGEIHFIREEFTSALEALEKGRGRDDKSNRQLFRTLDSIQKYKINKSPAPLSVVFEVIDSLKGYDFLVVSMMYYDSRIRENREDHISFVKKILSKLNKNWDSAGFSFDTQNKRLTLKGHINILSVLLDNRYGAKSLLHTLGVDYLDLRETAGISPRRMMNLKLNILDIRGQKINVMLDPSTAKILLLDEDLVEPEILEALKEQFIVNPKN